MMGLHGIACPSCQDGVLYRHVHPAKRVTVGGVGNVVVKNVMYHECNECGERLFDPGEMDRWRKEGVPYKVTEDGELLMGDEI